MCSKESANLRKSLCVIVFLVTGFVVTGSLRRPKRELVAGFATSSQTPAARQVFALLHS
jgi:hypothetical protein